MSEAIPRKVFEFKQTPGNPRNSEGSFLRLNDGRLMFAYSHFIGESMLDTGHGVIGARFSTDDGESWSEPRFIVPNEGKMNVMSASLLRLRDGCIAVFYLRKDGEEDACRPMMRISKDEAETWGEPIDILGGAPGYYVMNNDRAILLSSGRILLPLVVHWRPGDDGFQDGTVFSAVSDDNGMTWHTGQEHRGVNPMGESVILQEPGAVELKDGRVMMFCRTGEGCQYASFSDDEGETWDAPHPSSITGPLSPASITRMPTGDLLLVWNDHQDVPDDWFTRAAATDKRGLGRLRKIFRSNHVIRTPYSLAVSKDEGKTWILRKNLEGWSWGAYCYTSVCYLKDEVLLSYVHRGDTYCDRMIKVPYSWIYSDIPRKAYVYKESAFKAIVPGPFMSMDMPLGTWRAEGGSVEAVINEFGKGILLRGGQGTCLELELKTPMPLRLLSHELAVTRMAADGSYGFLMEALIDGRWTRIWGQDDQARTQFGIEPSAENPEQVVSQVRFLCTGDGDALIFEHDTGWVDFQPFFKW